MKNYKTDQELTDILTAPYHKDKLRWRVGRAGESNGKAWAMLLAYVDARDVRHRLDEAFGRMHWGVKYTNLTNGTIIANVWGECIINKEYVKKSAQDGAGETQVEREKGGISDAFKRASNAAFGVYEYLYDIKDAWANIHDNGKYKGQYKDRQGAIKYFKYDPPIISALEQPNHNTKPTFIAQPLNKINSCKTAEELKQVWEGLTPNDRKTQALVDAKDAMKKKFNV